MVCIEISASLKKDLEKVFPAFKWKQGEEQDSYCSQELNAAEAYHLSRVGAELLLSSVYSNVYSRPYMKLKDFKIAKRYCQLVRHILSRYSTILEANNIMEEAARLEALLLSESNRPLYQAA